MTYIQTIRPVSGKVGSIVAQTATRRAFNGWEVSLRTSRPD